MTYPAGAVAGRTISAETSSGGAPSADRSGVGGLTGTPGGDVGGHGLPIRGRRFHHAHAYPSRPPRPPYGGLSGERIVLTADVKSSTPGLPQTSATLGVAALCLLARVPERLPDAGGWVVRLALMIAVLSAARTLVRAPAAVALAARGQAAVGAWLAGEARMAAGSVCLGVVLALPLHALLRATSSWWVFAWILVAAFTLAAQGLAPMLLRALAGPVTPAGPMLAAQVRGIAGRAGVDVSRGVLLSGTEGRARGDARVVGFGRSRRMVLDRALAAWPPELVDQVVAHAIGHWRLGHASTRLQLTLAVELATAAIAAWLVDWPPLLDWAGAASAGDPRAYPFLALLAPVVVLPARLVLAWRDRAQERQADRFAIRLLGQPEAFTDMLEWAATEAGAPRTLRGWRRAIASQPPIEERKAAAAWLAGPWT
jgi:STE24 endopeptidase